MFRLQFSRPYTGTGSIVVVCAVFYILRKEMQYMYVCMYVYIYIYIYVYVYEEKRKRNLS